MTTPTNPPPTAPASAEPSHVEAFVRWARSNGLDVEFSADAGRVFADYLTELCYLATQEVPYSGVRAALDSQAAERLSCGHPAELMQYSAETGAPLYCELCDDKSGRRDAERREMELQAELAALRASAAEAVRKLQAAVEADGWCQECALEHVRPVVASLAAKGEAK